MNKAKLIALLITLIAAVIMGVWVLADLGFIGTASAASISVSNVFVDVDGDGDLDLLQEGSVIYNDPLALTQP